MNMNMLFPPPMYHYPSYVNSGYHSGYYPGYYDYQDVLVHKLPSPAPIVREVWDHNFFTELALMYRYLYHFEYKIVALDTEFPGTIFDIPSHVPKHDYASAPEEYYVALKKNTDALKLIQLGLTLSDGRGNVHAWQFNFRDFDPSLDLHNPDSIAMLRKQGINFLDHKRWGISSAKFFAQFRPFLEILRWKRVIWVTFQGSSDFAFLIKNMSGKFLPQDVGKFMEMVGEYFGFGNYDLKLVTRSVGIHGGLEKVAKQLGLERRSGIKHQAGSDSLLVMQVFMKVIRDYVKASHQSKELNHKLYGLTTLAKFGTRAPPSDKITS